MSFYGPLLLLEISWIFWLKKNHLVFLTILLNCFQSSTCLVNLYFLRSLLYFSFHQVLKCIVILTIFKFSSYILSIKQTRVRTTFSRDSTSNKSLVSIDLIVLIRLLMKTFSSSLFLTIIHFLVWICSLTIKIVIVSRAWSKMKCYSSWIEWLFSSSDPNCRNIKSRIKFKSWLLSEYLVETWLMGLDRPKLKNSAMSNNKLLWEE